MFQQTKKKKKKKRAVCERVVATNGGVSDGLHYLVLRFSQLLGLFFSELKHTSEVAGLATQSDLTGASTVVTSAAILTSTAELDSDGESDAGESHPASTEDYGDEEVLKEIQAEGYAPPAGPAGDSPQNHPGGAGASRLIGLSGSVIGPGIGLLWEYRRRANLLLGKKTAKGLKRECLKGHPLWTSEPFRV
ncbi:hypothetical protein DFJ73DRAFT_766081 [Zopfochytrium polystomum]|nr:hypothetical protein DFJ73DRAFT_766081 [Zopfochytrium polystomum]